MSVERILAVDNIEDALKAIRKYGYLGEVDGLGHLFAVLDINRYNKTFIEALLIKFVETAVGANNNDSDILLMVFGLLHGYEMFGDKGIASRRRLYIKESDFIVREIMVEYTAKGREPPKDKQKWAYDRLRTKIEDDLIKKLSQHIVSIKNMPEYAKRLNGYIEKNENGGLYHVILREPHYRQKQNLETTPETTIPKTASSESILIENTDSCLDQETSEVAEQLKYFDIDIESQKQKERDKARKEATIWIAAAFACLVTGVYIFWLIGVI